MRKHRSFRPTALSPLEDRVVPSHVGVASAALVQPVNQLATPVSQHVLALNGTVKGTFVTTITPGANGTAGTTTTFNGSGTITGLGQVSVTGSQVTLFSATGLVSTVDTFTLTPATGSVTIQFTRAASIPSTPPSTVSSFSIVKATGAFQGDIGIGTASLQTITELVPVVPPTVAKGVFTLTHSSNPLLL
jgi:hypothetical protein